MAKEESGGENIVVEVCYNFVRAIRIWGDQETHGTLQPCPGVAFDP